MEVGPPHLCACDWYNIDMPNLKPENQIKQLEALATKLETQASTYRRSTLERFPLLIIGLSTFGLVSVLYGFEKLIDSIPWLADRPLVILTVGLCALAVSGTLFKKLS